MTDKTQKPKLTSELVAAGIAERCYSDSDFRQSFIDNPKNCLEEACGKKLPDEVEIVACENSDSKWYVPVPPSGAREISEEDMAKLAGGEIALTAGIIAAGVAAGIATAAITTGLALAVWAGVDAAQGETPFSGWGV